jgi:hypothetical protein
VLLVPCLLHAAYRYWFLADIGAARTLITPDVALELDLDIWIPPALRRCTRSCRPLLYTSLAYR